MNHTPLDKIGLRWRDHKSAIWWLGLLYRRSAKFRDSLKSFSRFQAAKTGTVLYLHILFYIVLLCIFGRLFIFGWLKIPTKEILVTPLEIFQFHVFQIGLAISIEIAFVIISAIAMKITIGIAVGIALGIVSGIANGIIQGIANEIVVSIVLGIFMGITASTVIETDIRVFWDIAWRIPRLLLVVFLIVIFGSIVIGIVARLFVGISVGIAAGLYGGIVAFFCSLRVYYNLLFGLLIWPKPLGHLYPFHPVAWDDLCSMPFLGLERLLAAFTEFAPKKGEREITRLIETYPSQRVAALRAKTILLARKASRLTDLTQLEHIATEGRKSFFGKTSRLREMMQDIARLQIRLNTIDRPMFREPLAQTLCKEIENFQHRVAGFHEPLVSEFRQAAKNWLVLAERQLREAQMILDKEPKPQIFRAGEAVNRQQEAFVLRYGVVGNLEKQIMLATGCPGLVLYSRRRMGKSTILHNLSGFLPLNVLPANISMQNPQAFTSTSYFVQLLVNAVQKVLPSEKSPNAMPADLPSFFRFLSQCNDRLEQEDKRLLLALDEYENIDVKIGERVFAEDDLLATLRESIQTHRCLTWIFAGSHAITELKHATWTSYLVSARTLEVPMFTSAETRLLLTEPLKHSERWSKNDPKCPHFAPEFWGENGIERIQHEAGGWPHLVQLIAETIVDLINDETKRQVDAELFERSLNKAIVSGHNVLYQLMRGESILPGEWEYLSAFRKRETPPPPDNEAIYTSLRRRLLVEEENGEWRLRVPLMARWLKERG